MKIERTRNAGRNIAFGTILKIYQMAATFIMRTVMIYFMGVEYLGLNSLFTSVLQVLNLAELGIGSAMVYSMYKPIAEDDQEKICALMRLYKIYYRIIGGVILSVGLLLLPFISIFIKGDVPSDINVYIIYIMHLITTVLSYWLFSYMNCLFTAHQRGDVVSKVTIVVNTAQYVVQIIVICLIKNYYLYLLVSLITQVAINISVACMAKKKYPHYKAEGKLDKNEINGINKRIKDLFTAKIGTVIVNSADTIVISSYLGLTVLGMYQNYFLVVTSVAGFVTIILHSCMAGIGNSIITETKEKNYCDLRKLTFIVSWILCFATSCMLCMYQPFMSIWVGEKYMFEFSVVICLCMYFFTYEIMYMWCVFKDAAGIWHEDRWRPFITAITNLIMNIVMVRFWGVYGVMLSTVLSMIVIGIPWLLKNLFTTIFEKKYMRSYIRQIILYSTEVIGICALTYLLCTIFSDGYDIAGLLIRLGICCTVPNILFAMFNCKKTEFEYVFSIIKRIRRNIC